MKELAVKAEQCFEKLYDKVVVVLGTIIFFAFSYYSARYTEILQEEEIIETNVDSVGGNLFFWLLTMAFFVLLRVLFQRMDGEKLHRFACVVKVLSLLYVGVVCVLWISSCYVRPRADASVICKVAGYLYNGDYATMEPPGYMSFCPHQYGMVFLLEQLYSVFGSKHYMAFQYINVFWVLLAMYAGYKLIELIFESDVVSIFYSLLAVTCVPMILYVAFVYGEVPFISLCMVLMWNAVKYCKTGSKYAIPGIIFPAAAAGVIKMNAVIAIIAAAIVLLLWGLKKRKVQVLLIVACIFPLMFGINSGIKKMYEERSGIEVNKGIPSVSWIMMGLQDTEAGPGWYNGSNFDEFGKYDFDHEATKAANTEWIKARLGEMWQNKAASVDFFRRKILSQWNAPEYCVFDTLYHFDDGEFEVRPKSVQSLFRGELRAFLDGFMNRYQFVLYVSLLIYSISLLFHKNPVENHILLIAIIGGFFFSMMWEAKSRYILPYLVYSLPLAAMGIYKVSDAAMQLWQWVRSKKGDKINAQ